MFLGKIERSITMDYNPSHFDYAAIKQRLRFTVIIGYL